MGLLSAIIFLPAAGAAAILILRGLGDRTLRAIALIAALLSFALSLQLFAGFEATAEYQFVEWRPWVPQYGISYHLGVDGISLFLVLLTTFLGWVVVLSSWNEIRHRVPEYLAFLLLLETGILGVFLALDLVLFYVFWEAMLIPMYFLIGIWGGPNRIYATLKFFLYTFAGSVLMLAAILALFAFHQRGGGPASFDLPLLLQTQLDPSTQLWLFAAFALAFAIKVPLWPLHTWLPDAHVEAPTAGSVILAGVLLKMGTYGFVRFALPLFPDATRACAPLFLLLSVIGILYGALVALAQEDIKKLVAYSSVSHLGFVMLGLFALNPIGVAGGVLQMVNHGLSTGGLFLMVGMLYERRHTRMLADYGGIAAVVPRLTFCFMLIMLSSVGLPFLNGFTGEFLILLGGFQAARAYAIAAAIGVILAAVYLLTMFLRAMFGPIVHEENRKLADLSLREAITLAPLLLLIVLIGVYPGFILERLEPSVQAFLQQIGAP
ncbi:MAG TPA: NADH-quinone oxidoreductase subunit M [Acidobacteriota bacterium]